MFLLRHIVAGTAPGGASGEVGVGFQVVFSGKERVQTPEKIDAVLVVHGPKLIRGHQLFATMSSDELKKSVAKRLLVLQRSINLIQFIRLQIQHFISAFCFFMGNLL